MRRLLNKADLFLRRAFLVVRCFLKSRKKSNGKTFVILQPAKLGDMVCTTPMMRAIKKTHPNARVVMVGNALNKGLLEGNADVDHYIVLDKKNHVRTAAEIAGEHASWAFLTGPGFDGLAILLLSGIPHVVAPEIQGGRSPQETISYRILRMLAIKKPHRMEQYAPREYLRLLEPAGIFSEKTQKHLSVSSEDESTVSSWIRDAGIPEGELLVGIALGVGNSIKQWPLDRFVEVAHYLSEKYKARIVLVGGAGERNLARTFLQCFDSPKQVLNAVGIFSIGQLKALLKCLDLFIAVDTGPIYIAEAFEIPTIDIAGPVDEREQPPRGERHFVVVNRGGKPPAVHIMNARDYDFDEARRQVGSITAQQVFHAIDSVFKTLNY